MSIYIQFDGTSADLKGLEEELKATGIKILSIKSSRWRDEQGNDKGGRIDVELEDDGGTPIEVKQKIAKVSTEMNKAKKWKKKQ